MHAGCRYIADVLAEGRVARAAAGGDAARLLFKKRMFRETDEAISEPIFISLSFVQAQHDYLEVCSWQNPFSLHLLRASSLPCGCSDFGLAAHAGVMPSQL